MSVEEDESHDEITESINTAVVMKTSWGIILCGTAWMSMSYYLNEPFIIMLTIPAFLGTILAFALVLLGRPLLGRCIWNASGLVAVTWANFTVHSAANPEIMYLILIGGPFLTFAIGKENLQLTLMLVATAISFGAVLMLGNDFFGPPIIGEEVSKNYLASGILIMVFFLICIEMGTFGILAHTNQLRLKESRKQARHASHAKSDFLAAMSHEIRTPMNGVVGMVEILENSKLTTEQSRIVETIRDSSTALLSIIEDILDMSRIEAGKLELTLQKTEVLKVFEKSADTLRPFAEAHNVNLSMSFDPRLPEFISSDPGRLRQITLNFLSNAIKFSKRPAEDPSGLVLLKIGYCEQGNLELSISDNGIGIVPEFLPNLFDPFEQSAEVRRLNFGGSGLGLAIVSQLAEKLGGSIGVESQPGLGSTFTVCLPIVDPEGRIHLPDLTGKTIGCFDCPTGGVPHVRKLIESCNGEFVVFQTKEDLVAAAQTQDDNVVYIVPNGFDQRQDGIAPVGQSAWNLPQDTKMIFLSKSQDELAKQQTSGRIVLLSSPVLISALTEAFTRVFDLGSPKQQILGSDMSHVSPSNTSAGAPRILAAEDNETNRVVLTAQLNKLEYSSVVVEDGAKAFELWKTGEFDLILTDCKMPKVDGFELTRMIREEEAKQGTGHFPIIAITANALRGENDRCLSAGMDAYLTKPTTLDELEVTLKKYLGKTAKAHRFVPE